MKTISFALAAPLAVIIALLALPESFFEWEWDAPTFHFWVVSVASLLSAAICIALILSARSIRETRILFLALSFFTLSLVFAVHGLTTPGHLYQHATAALERSPFLSTFGGGVFAALSVVSIPRFSERARLRLPEMTFALFAGLIVLYFSLSLMFPDWLEGFPTRQAWFRYLLSALTIGLLLFAASRYLQSYLFARLPGQLAVMAALVLLAEAQVSLALGEVWYLVWWMYHLLFLAAFLSVLAGWAWQMLRTRDVRAIAEALVMRDALAQLKRGRPAPLVTLADQIENHDPATFRHVDRVAAHAYAIGQQMGFGSAHLRELVLAAQLHDIGKIGLPGYILTKPGKLTDEEFSLIKQHPAKGWEIVRRLPSIEKFASVIRHHHERFDGAGYPDGLAGDAIPLEARIIAVADTFDALTSERPYRPAMTQQDAEAELRRVAGSQLDPACVRALLAVLQSHPPSGDGTSRQAARPRSAPRVAMPSSQHDPTA